MFRPNRILAALAICGLAPLLQAATSAPRGEIVGDDVYVNCEYRVAAQFPAEPKFRDITYRNGDLSAPAREFYLDRAEGLLSVKVVYIANGPALDPELIKRAAETLRQRGNVRYDASVYYDEPGIPGRQLNIALADGRKLGGSVYMANNRLYITEAISGPNDIPAFVFEQSVSLLDENGTDLDSNPINLATNAVGTSAGLPNRQYDCSRINRKH